MKNEEFSREKRYLISFPCIKRPMKDIYIINMQRMESRQLLSAHRML